MSPQVDRRLQVTSARSAGLAAPPGTVREPEQLAVIRFAVHGVRVPTLPPKLRSRPVSPVDGRRHPTATATDTGDPNGGAGAVIVVRPKVRVGRRGRVLVAAQRRRRFVRVRTSPPAAAAAAAPPPSVAVGVPVAPPAAGVSAATAAAAAAAGRHGRRTAAAADGQNDAATTAEGGQGATDPEAHERVHGVGQGGTEKVGRRKSRLAQRRPQQDAR